MTKLHQIIAVESGAKSRASQAVDTAYKVIQKPELFQGLARSYKAKDEEGDQLPAEHKGVQVKVDELLGAVAADWTRLLDLTATKDTANTQAKADVRVDGQVVLSDVPVTTLLYLEKQLTDLRTFVSKLPTLDPAEDWEYDTGVDAYATPFTESTRTKKVYKNHVKAEATEHHPAQVEVFTEDVVVGTYSTRKFSGAVPAKRRNEMLRRVEALQDAVKVAREEANELSATPVAVGDKIFEFVLGG